MPPNQDSAHLVNSIAATEATLAAAHRPTKPPSTFIACSLKGWLEVTRALDLPRIEAELLDVLPVTDLLYFDHPGMLEKLAPRLTAINRQLDDQSMLRWDCCAPSGIKYMMHKRGSLSVEAGSKARTLSPDDPRFYDILFEFPSEEMAVWKRPIVMPLKHDTHPVEFRIFVQGGEIIAASNYYPQIALSPTSEHKAYLAKALEYSAALLESIKGSGVRPWMPTHKTADQLDATLDFMVSEQGDVLFLEGGPGFGHGAHPCCFWNDDSCRMTPLNGVMFRKSGEVMPLQDFMPSHGRTADAASRKSAP